MIRGSSEYLDALAKNCNAVCVKAKTGEGRHTHGVGGNNKQTGKRLAAGSMEILDLTLSDGRAKNLERPRIHQLEDSAQSLTPFFLED
jgi:hypothetical protein